MLEWDLTGFLIFNPSPPNRSPEPLLVLEVAHSSDIRMVTFIGPRCVVEFVARNPGTLLSQFWSKRCKGRSFWPPKTLNHPRRSAASLLDITIGGVGLAYQVSKQPFCSGLNIVLDIFKNTTRIWLTIKITKHSFHHSVGFEDLCRLAVSMHDPVVTVTPVWEFSGRHAACSYHLVAAGGGGVGVMLTNSN